MNYIPEFIIKVIDMWKKPSSFLITFFVWIGLETHYLSSLESDSTSSWVEQIEISKIILYSLIPICMFGYILWKRSYIPKASRKKKGVMICITNADNKNYKTIVEKFVDPFRIEVNNNSSAYDILVLDDYHSKIICKKIGDFAKKDKRDLIAKILRQRNCRVMIQVHCTNGGEREELLCQLSTEFTVIHPSLPIALSNILKKEMLDAIAPVRTVRIISTDETATFQKYTVLLNYAFKYVFATVQLYCDAFQESLSGFNDLLKCFESEKNLDETLRFMKTSVMNKIGLCNTALASIEYNNYCETMNKQHLVCAKAYIDNKYCRNFYYQHNVVLRGICFFVIDDNVSAALQCMQEATLNDPVVKFNKVFLKLFSNPTITNYIKAYNVYKSLNKLEQRILLRVEDFIYNTYKEHNEKSQLLFLLFLIYDYRENSPLAKKAITEFCQKADLNNLMKSTKFKEMFEPLNNKYIDVPLDSEIEL